MRKIYYLFISSLLFIPISSKSYGQELKITHIRIPKNIYDSLNYIDLKPNNEAIKISYSQNSFFVFFKPQYKGQEIIYHLKNLNQYAIKTTNDFIFLTNLPNGEYELILTTNLDKNNKPVIQKIIIEPPIWLRWWFLPSMFLYGIILIVVLGYFLFLYRLRQQLRLQTVRHELEIKALRAQMNPHFIFNSMNTIDAYILRKKFIEASDCLQKFSKLIRKILENSENQTISISQELETLKLYIELEQERFSHTFSYQFDIEPELLEKDYQIPPLLIQPFVENAILHGIRHLTDRKGEVIIKLAKLAPEKPNENPVLFCQIQDNGIGREKATEINLQRQATHKSMGINITMERISTHQAIYGNKMKTRVIDLIDGTKIELKLPLIIS